MRFVVTGLSRSGTKYAAKLWTQLGYRCGHESVFNIFDVTAGHRSIARLPRSADVDGDSSFLAAPWLDRLPRGTVVFHQLRSPLEVVRSHLGIRFFAEPPVPSIYLADNHADFVEYVVESCPALAAERGEAERCMRYWAAWNALISESVARAGLPYLRYRVEDLDADLVRRMIAALGDDPGSRDVEGALAAVPRNANSRRRDGSIGWADLPGGPAKEAALDAAEACGYAAAGLRS